VARTLRRFRIGPRGELEIVDPGFDALPLLRSIDPEFRIRQAALPLAHRPPVLQQTRMTSTRLDAGALLSMSEAELWRLHDELSSARRGLGREPAREGEASLMSLKTLIARRLLRSCNLCARRCNVDRTRAETGVCGLGEEAFVAEHFVHIAEEAAINPSLVLNLRGCALRCRFCQQHAILDPHGCDRERLSPALWDQIDVRGARSLSFVGGNPDESLPAVLACLEAAPRDWVLPIVWNSHAYSTPEAMRLLDGVVDAYVPDLKYMNRACAQRLSGVANYPEMAMRAIHAMLLQGVAVLVRILVLPGHVECCHLPALEFLAGLRESELLFISIRAQYSPDWRIVPSDGPLNRRPNASETKRVTVRAQELGLRAVQ
jgi:putative pyruvate formate lyase activating enzyme